MKERKIEEETLYTSTSWSHGVALEKKKGHTLGREIECRGGGRL